MSFFKKKEIKETGRVCVLFIDGVIWATSKEIVIEYEDDSKTNN